jgi:hypothetical protein
VQIKCFWLLLLAVMPLASAQSLSVSSASVKQGDRGSILISLASPSDRRPIALQWDLLYPDDELAIRPDDLVTGSAALGADKALTCAAPPKQKLYRCILVGGQKPIPDGPVAIINFQVSDRARVGAPAIQIRNPIALSPKTQRIDLSTVDGRIAIEAR